ncbi:MAG: hypothetical protein Q9191_002865 [Dirinaria sp. TL-2023a]
MWLAKLVLSQGNSTGPLGTGCHSSAYDDINQALLRPNATGSYSRPSPFSSDNTSIPAGDWTWNTAIIVKGDNQVWQEWWVETPALEGVKDRDIPFQVCAIGFDGLPRKTYSNGQDDPGDCSSTLDQECVTALTKLASQSSGKNLDHCINIMSQIRYHTPPECQPFGNWGKSWGSTIFEPSSNDNAAAAIGCNTDNNNTVQPLIGIGDDTLTTVSEFNETTYDEAIYRVVPVLTTIFSNRSGVGEGSSTLPKSNLICMRAKDVRVGSRAPPALEATESALALNDKADQRSLASRGRQVATSGILALALLVMLLNIANC